MYRHLASGLLLLWLLPGHPLQAQSLEGGARAVALSNATTALDMDPWGHTNPASWGAVPTRTLAFFTSQAFGLSALRLGAIHALQPTRFGTLALGLRTFGYTAYRESHLNLGYARAVHLGTSRDLFVGVRLRYYRIQIDGYGSGGAVGLTAGWLVSVLPTLYAGAQATNFNVPRIAGREALERTFSIGLNYVPNPQFRLLMDGFKEIRFPLSIRAGLEISPVEALALRAGLTSAPSRITTGLGVRLGLLQADVAAEYHEVLGWSPAFSVHLLL